MCPTNWFPFFISEVGGRLCINRVFPRQQTNLSSYASHSHYRQLVWQHLELDFSSKTFCWIRKWHTNTTTHLHIHPDRRTHTQYDFCMSGHWRPRRKLTTSSTSTCPRWPTEHISLNQPFFFFFRWLKLRHIFCQVYFWHSQIIRSLLTSAVIGLCLHALQVKLT